MAKCAWDYTPRSGSYAGVDTCTLTGRPCIIDAPNERPRCTRAAQIRAFQAKHYPGQQLPERSNKLASPGAGIQPELPFPLPG